MKKFNIKKILFSGLATILSIASFSQAPVGQISIPVIFHIYQDAEPNSSNLRDVNFTLSDVENALDIVNQMYAGTYNTHLLHSSQVGKNANTQISFHLATEDPLGFPTNGLNYLPGFSYFQDFNNSQFLWDQDKYINIFVADLAASDGGSATPARYFPSIQKTSPGASIQILSRVFNFGVSTLAHELGHYLNLIHTFQLGCDNEGDLVADTQTHLVTDINPTNNSNITHSSCDPNEYVPFNNLMSYYPNSRRLHFTNGQKERMRNSFAPDGDLRQMAQYNVGAGTNAYQPVSILPALPIYSISNVTVGTINNNSGHEPSGYADYSYLSTDMTPLQQYNMEVTANAIHGSITVLIDLNRDGDFYDQGEYVVSNHNKVISGFGHLSTRSISFTLPATNYFGPTRMRVIASYNPLDESSVNTPITGNRREYEDYTVNLVSPSATNCDPQLLVGNFGCGVGYLFVQNASQSVPQFHSQLSLNSIQLLDLDENDIVYILAQGASAVKTVDCSVLPIDQLFVNCPPSAKTSNPLDDFHALSPSQMELLRSLIPEQENEEKQVSPILSQLSILPNPIHRGGSISINIDDFYQGIVEVDIFSLNGQLVQKQLVDYSELRSFKINSDLSEGLYLIQTKYDNNIQTAKLLIKK